MFHWTSHYKKAKENNYISYSDKYSFSDRLFSPHLSSYWSPKFEKKITRLPFGLVGEEISGVLISQPWNVR